VLAVLYLLFTRGYDADGEPAFADEAIRLARLLGTLLPGEPEIRGLLALCLLQHSRRAARRDEDGNLRTLDQQDRSRWDHAAIAEALALLPEGAGPYALQARIAACHTTTPTDWPAVAELYDRLFELLPTPVVALNRAVAHGYAYRPADGLWLLAEARSGGALDGYPYAIAVEADLTAKAGDSSRAVSLFERAAAAAPSEPERRALLARAEELTR
jgi:RNA polymerase sigma-70 factor (ECF subfamily)